MTQTAEPTPTQSAADSPNPHAAELIPTRYDDLKKVAEEAKAAANAEENAGKSQEEILESVAEAIDPNAVKPPPAAAPPPPAAEGLSALKKKIEERKQTHGKTLELEQARAQVQQQQQELHSFKASLEKQAQELTSRLKEFQENPLGYLEKTGFDKDKLAEHFVRAGSPEHKLERELSETRSQVQELVEYIRADKQQAIAREQQAQEHARATARQTTEQQFLAQAGADVAPNLHAVAQLTGQGQAYIISQADKIAEWFKAETGKYPTWPEITEYLEQEASERLSKVSGAKLAAPNPKNAGQLKAPPRTLSGELGSERRSAPASLSTLSPEERKRELIRVAEEAKHASKG